MGRSAQGSRGWRRLSVAPPTAPVDSPHGCGASEDATRGPEAEVPSALENPNRALDAAFPRLYPDLLRRARRYLQREGPELDGQAPALVHEAYLRLLGSRRPHWESRSYLFAAAAQAMRRILIEHARSRAALRHGGEWRRFPLTEQNGRWEPKPEELVAVDEAVAHLERADPRLARVVELRYFAGLTVPETARALEISPRTVNRRWAAARAWLAAELNGRRSVPPAAP